MSHRAKRVSVRGQDRLGAGLESIPCRPINGDRPEVQPWGSNDAPAIGEILSCKGNIAESERVAPAELLHPLGEALGDGIAGELGNTVDIELRHGVLPVGCHGFGTDFQLGGDLLGRVTLRQQLHDFTLPGGQS